ncbi:MAG: 3-phosphoserine/phosphohydroxythreonine transaminase, partial [Bacteroidota bacterium]
MNRKHNFGAGPGILPESALKKAAQAVLDFNGSGMSILEISH